ncbi:MAG: MFS transporter [Opitutia bacterium Tous-C1TDCM]|nr:MAG: MFS transporter [Opitutae bacterium Tous-C1TDCM]
MNATAARTAALQSKADLARSLRLSTAEGVMAMPIVTMSLPVNVFMTALVAKAFPLPKTTIGLICALPFLGNFLQIFIAPFLARWKPPKIVSISASVGHLLGWSVLGVALPWLQREDPAAAGRWLIVWFLATSCFGAVSGVSWNAWVQEWVPPRIRGKYFGRRNGTVQFSTLTFMLVAGWSLAQWNYGIRVFQVLIAGAVAMRMCSLYWQWISPTRPSRETAAAALPLREQVRIVLGSRSLLVFIAFGAVWSFAANCFGPFYHLFMFDQLGLSAFEVGLLSTLAQLSGALALPAWGHLLDRYGNKSVMTFSLILWQLQNFLWCFLEPDNRNLLYAMWIWGGATSAGFILGQFTILLRLIPVEAKNFAIGVNLATTSLVAAIAPVTGGAVLTWALTRWTDVFAVHYVCFLLQPVLALAGCFLLLRVHEPQASPLTMVFGAMRNIRTLSGVFGLSFLVNYVFYRQQKERPTPPPRR